MSGNNHLLVQVVSESLAPNSPLLSSLLLMDNDIATVAEGALDVVKDLKQLDLTGKPQNITLAKSLSLNNKLPNSSSLSRPVHGKLKVERFDHIQNKSLLFF